MFQNIYRLQRVGIFGNADPHLVKDWIEVIQPKDESASSSVFNTIDKKCDFPSAYTLEIFYSKINTKSQPHYRLVRVEHRPSTVSTPWQYSLESADPKTQKQDF